MTTEVDGSPKGCPLCYDLRNRLAYRTWERDKAIAGITWYRWAIALSVLIHLAVLVGWWLS